MTSSTSFSTMSSLTVLAFITAACLPSAASTGSVKPTTSTLLVSSLATDDRMFSDARCRVRCLSLLQSELSRSSDEEDMDDGPTVSLEDCAGNDVCSASAVDGLTEACKDSCRFLSQINAIRAGTCPPETQATGHAAVCADMCSSDADCVADSQLKCCSNSCGWTCQRPNHMFDGLPDVAGMPVVTEHPPDPVLKRDGVVEVSWSGSSPNSTSGPLLYALQWRWHHQRSAAHHGGTAHQHNKLHAGVAAAPSGSESVDTVSSTTTHWQQIAQVTGTSVILSDDIIKPGRWYQFRVAAVSVYGSHGWSRPSALFTSSAKPRKPGPPVNVTLGDRILADGRISVPVQWLPPATTDVPVTRYKLYWSKRSGPGTPALTSAREYRQVLPGDRLSFTVSDLDVDSMYFFQIQSITQFGDVKLKSERINAVIDTSRHLQSRDQHYRMASPGGGSISSDFDDDDDDEATPLTLTLHADKPVYDNGNVRVNVSWTLSGEGFGREWGPVVVYWSPEACIDTPTKEGGLPKTMSSTTMGRHYVIHNLWFDCRYVVRVERGARGSSSGGGGSRVQGQGQGHGDSAISANLALSIPSCSQISVAPGQARPKCPGSAVTSLIPREPHGLQHSFIISNSNNITARLSWLAPSVDGKSSDSSSDSEVPISGYRVVWGQLVQSDPVQMESPGLTKVLPKDVRELNIAGLLPATTYIARVQSLAASSAASHVTSILFTTPLLQTSVNDRHYGDQSNADNQANRRPFERRQRRPHDAAAASNSNHASPNAVTMVTVSSRLQSTVGGGFQPPYIVAGDDSLQTRLNSAQRGSPSSATRVGHVASESSWYLTLLLLLSAHTWVMNQLIVLR